jgi:UDP-N-acetylmuramate dehydrogenase
MKVAEHVPFSAITTFKVGGVARYLITLESIAELPEAVQFAHQLGLPLIPIGGGSNILGPDGTYDAVLVRVGWDDSTFQGTTVTVSAGASWDRVVREAVERGLWGIENLSAIPGTMGGAVVQNIGAYGAALSDTLVSVTAFDTQTSKLVTLGRTQCAFGYRTSVFKAERDRYIICSAELRLSETPRQNLGYKDLSHLKDATPSLATIRDAVVQIRAHKFPNLSEFGTAGSFFLNPIADAEAARTLQSRFPNMPVFELPEGGIKIPLGWFFEHVLALKGFRSGAVEAWRAQALVVAAHPGATSTEIKNFVAHITDRAKKELQIDIVPEVRML